MKALRKQTFRTLFFPPEKPTEKELTVGRRRFIEEGAVAAVIYSIATGNFLVGYLSYLGASVSFCALVAMIPNFGCVLQFFSPFLFERMHNRKLAIWILCLIYRLPLGMMMLLPAFLPDPGTVRILTVVLYTVSFLSAGMVTPGLQHMSLGLAPEGAKGRFFALKDIVCSCVNSGVTLLLGWQLDHFNAKGEFYTGFFIIGIVCLLLAVLDAVLLALVRENPVEFVSRLHVSDLLIPVKDQKFRPVFFYSVLAGLFSGLASPFLSVYEVRILGLSHTFITGVGVVSGIAAMAGSWFWGRYADRNTWNRVVWMTALFNLSCALGWSFVGKASAPFAAPVLMVLAAACTGGSAIAFSNLEFVSTPPSGKTAYIGITAATTSLASTFSSAAATRIQSFLETSFGDRAIAILFVAAAVGGFLNLFLFGRRLPSDS